MRRRAPKSHRFFGILIAVSFTACGVPPSPSALRVINVHASSAAFPWLAAAYACTPSQTAVRVADPESSDISLRLGEPAPVTSLEYQIGTEDILVIVHPQTGVRSLMLDQARRLFSGQVTRWKDVGGADMSVEVWTFSAGEDIAAIFDRSVMHAQPISSLARLAVSAQAMSDSVGASPGAIGFLPRRLKASNTAEALVVASVPVLAVASSQPQGAISDLLRCLQSKK